MKAKKKAMISQPMAGRTDAEIVEAREKAVAELEGLGYEVVNTLFTDEWYSDEAMEGRGVVQIPLQARGEVQVMARTGLRIEARRHIFKWLGVPFGI